MDVWILALAKHWTINMGFFVVSLPNRSRALIIYKFLRKPLKVTEKCLRLGSHPISLESNLVSVLRSLSALRNVTYVYFQRQISARLKILSV